VKPQTRPAYVLRGSAARAAVEQRRWREDYGVRVIAFDPLLGHPEGEVFVSSLMNLWRKVRAESRT
jgi:hypothetical protein